MIEKIRPGMLVALSTRLRGGVKYERVDLNHERDGSTDIAKWETERKITDAEEYDAAKKLQSRVRALIESVSIWTPFGIICPTDNVEQLDEKIAEAQALCAEFNDSAQYSHVSFSVLRGEIAESDREARESVAAELDELLRDLERAMETGKVKDIRRIASRLKQTSRVLEAQSPEARSIERAVASARKIAKQIVARVSNQETIDDLLNVGTRSSVNAARCAILGQEDAA